MSDEKKIVNIKIVRSVRIDGKHVEKGTILSMDLDKAETKDLLASGRAEQTKESPKAVEKPKAS
jgi:hypothetical protein